MVVYSALTPLHAYSFLNISKSGYFTHIIIYDYFDEGQRHKYGQTYHAYISHSSNYQQEINTFKNNLQFFLDKEQNIINGKQVPLHIIHCDIDFHDIQYPFVKWIVIFKGEFHQGINVYENITEEEILEYPINSSTILESPMKISLVDTKLDYIVASDNTIIEYYGKTGKKIGPYDKIEFFY